MIKETKHNKLAGKTEIVVCVFCLLLFFVFALILLMSLGILSLSWFYSYPEIIAWKMQKIDFLKGHFSMTFYIPTTFANYQLSKIISVVLWIGLVVLVVISFLNRKRLLWEIRRLCAMIYQVVNKCRLSFTKLSVAEKFALLFLLLLSIVLRILLYFYIPPHIDELSTYFQFVDKGPIFISIFYPFPNNHFFFNHVYFFFSLLVDDILLAGRLPSMIFFHLLLVLLFFWVLVYLKDKYAAFLSIMLCIFLFPSSIYAVEARGYMLLSLLSVVAACSLLLAIETRKRQAFYIFVAACTLAAYTIPVFFVPFVGMMLFGMIVATLNKSKWLFSHLLVAGSTVGLAVMVCYMPVFMFSGVEAIINNRFVTSLDIDNFYSYVLPIVSAEMLSFLAGVPTKGWVIFFIFGLPGVLILFTTTNNSVRYWLLLTACILGSLFLYALLRKSIMFERSATYNVYFIYTTFSIILFYLFNYVKNLRTYRPATLYLILALTIPTAYKQYQYNRYENHLLPDPFYTKMQKTLDNAIADKATIYLGDETLISYRMVYYQYRIDQADAPSLLQRDYLKADILMINQYKLERLNYDLDNFVAIDSIRGIEGEPESLVWVFRKLKNSFRD